MLIHERKGNNIGKIKLDFISKNASWAFVMLQIIPKCVVHNTTILLVMFCSVTTASSFFGINIKFITRADWEPGV